MFLVLTKFGSNFNKRWYIGLVWGINPSRTWIQENHPLYPWWKRYRISFGKFSGDTFEV